MTPFQTSTSSERGRLLVFAPHADDEVLGAGGAMALAARAGWEVTAVFGTVSGYRSKAIGTEPGSEERLNEARAALRVLGCQHHHILFDDSHHLRLDTLPLSDVVSPIEALLARSPPHV